MKPVPMNEVSARMLAALECATLDLREVAVSVQEANRRLARMTSLLDRADRDRRGFTHR